ncbi:MAG: DegV family protein [Lachnospiraceae bacterium]|nr:DegV family protein [Lachnospiraceae bacterium]
MRTFDIISDGSCDLTIEQIKEYGIKIIPFYVSLDGTNYFKEIEELSLDVFYEKMLAEDLFPRTSLPSIQDYIDIFKSSLDEGKDVICFTITNTLSGSYQSALSAKQILEETYTDSRIHVVNSFHATGSLALMLREVNRMRTDAVDIDTVYDKVIKMRPVGRIMFMVGSLKHLEHGGRIGKMTFVAGNLLSLKPLIELSDGEIHAAGVVRSRKKGLQKLIDKSIAYFKNNGEDYKDYTFVVGTTNNWEEVPGFEKDLKEAFPEAEFLSPFQIGATISSHTGPYTTGICFVKKYEKL